MVITTITMHNMMVEEWMEVEERWSKMENIMSCFTDPNPWTMKHVTWSMRLEKRPHWSMQKWVLFS